MIHRPPRLFYGISLLLSLGLAGCARSDRPELAEVQGLVTLDGKPLPRATVVFQPIKGGRTSRGTTDAAGQYHLIYLRDIKGAILGSHKVTITTATEDVRQERLPARYNRQTALTAEIQAGTNQQDFILTSK
jgi:hypothetical protein